MNERLVAAVAAILLSFLLQSLNVSIACREREEKREEKREGGGGGTEKERVVSLTP